MKPMTIKNKSLQRILHNRMIDRKFQSPVKFSILTDNGFWRVKPPIKFTNQ